jgi:VanZ family protein
MWRLWLPVAVYVAIIFTLSSIPYLKPPVLITNADKVEHFLEYGLFGLLLFRAFRGTWKDRTAIRAIVLTILSGLLVAVLDELYQGTVPGRQKSAFDALADVIGVTLAALLGLWITHTILARRPAVPSPEAK